MAILKVGLCDDFDCLSAVRRLGNCRSPAVWIKVCSALQIPLAGQKSWSMMEAIYFNE